MINYLADTNATKAVDEHKTNENVSKYLGIKPWTKEEFMKATTSAGELGAMMLMRSPKGGFASKIAPNVTNKIAQSLINYGGNIGMNSAALAGLRLLEPAGENETRLGRAGEGATEAAIGTAALHPIFAAATSADPRLRVLGTIGLGTGAGYLADKAIGAGHGILETIGAILGGAFGLRRGNAKNMAIMDTYGKHTPQERQAAQANYAASQELGIDQNLLESFNTARSRAQLGKLGETPESAEIMYEQGKKRAGQEEKVFNEFLEDISPAGIQDIISSLYKATKADNARVDVKPVVERVKEAMQDATGGIKTALSSALKMLEKNAPAEAKVKREAPKQYAVKSEAPVEVKEKPKAASRTYATESELPQKIPEKQTPTLSELLGEPRKPPIPASADYPTHGSVVPGHKRVTRVQIPEAGPDLPLSELLGTPSKPLTTIPGYPTNGSIVPGYRRIRQNNGESVPMMEALGGQKPFEVTGSPYPYKTNLRPLHNAKMAMEDLAEYNPSAGDSSIKKAASNAVKNVVKELREQLGKASPVYKTASRLAQKQIIRNQVEEAMGKKAYNAANFDAALLQNPKEYEKLYHDLGTPGNTKVQSTAQRKLELMKKTLPTLVDPINSAVKSTLGETGVKSDRFGGIGKTLGNMVHNALFGQYNKAVAELIWNPQFEKDLLQLEKIQSDIVRSRKLAELLTRVSSQQVSASLAS
jgi:hypothetical protein